MASTDVALNQGTDSRQDREPVVNNFSIQIATVNGSGSQSANSVLMRTIFQMGVPVSGKNLFPSNIAGLPTWFTIRISKDGYVARKRDSEVLVAMNAETAAADIMALKPGSVVLFDAPLKLDTLRDDLVFYSAPFDKLVGPVTSDAKLKKLLRNMVYVGAMAHLLSLEMAEVEEAIRKQFRGKARATEVNLAAARAGYEYAVANLAHSRFQVQRMNENANKIIIDGNEAGGAGRAVCRSYGGVLVSDYALVFADRELDRVFEGISRRRQRESYVRGGAGRGRTGRHRDGAGCFLGRSPRDDRYLRSGNLADGRVHGPGLLCRDSGGDLECAEGWAFDWFADAHHAGRSALDGFSLARRYQASDAATGVGAGVL